MQRVLPIFFFGVIIRENYDGFQRKQGSAHPSTEEIKCIKEIYDEFHCVFCDLISLLFLNSNENFVNCLIFFLKNTIISINLISGDKISLQKTKKIK